MDIKISKEVSKILDFARNEALRTGCQTIGAGHLMLALIRHKSNPAMEILSELNIDTNALKAALDDALFKTEAIPYDQAASIKPDKEARKVLSIAAYEALKEETNTVSTGHVLLALSRAGFETLDNFFYQSGLDYDILLRHLQKRNGNLSSGKTPAPILRHIMGALGEQLSNIIHDQQDSSCFPS